MMTSRILLRRLRRAALPGWNERLMALGAAAIAASGTLLVTQLAVAGRAAPPLIPADSLAVPYEAGPHWRSLVDPDPTSTVAAPAQAMPTLPPTPPPACPLPSLARRPGVPLRDPLALVIPRIHVDAAVEQAGLDRRGRMQVPSSQCDVAWYKLGAVPGAPGDAVIDGHLDWTTGPSVFWNLHLLHRGDEIDVIQNSGARVRFVVTRVLLLAHGTDQTGLFSPSGPATLSLYTCAGIWEPSVATYSQRLVVDAAPVR